MRINESNLKPPIQRGKKLEILVDGNPLIAYEGETVATAMIAHSGFILRYTSKRGLPRSVYCGIGICHECRVIINGIPNIKACITLVQPGMDIQTQYTQNR